LMISQKRAIKYLERKVCHENFGAILEKNKEPALLVVAHFQPEATSFPEGGDLNNHIDIVVKLRTLGYTAPILYKEHIGSTHYFAPIVHQTRVGMCRSVFYYQKLEELGCIFVGPRVPIPRDPNMNERFVPVSITGTIALERSILGLRTIITGYPWYRGLPGTMNLSSIRSFENGELASKTPCPAISEESFAFLDAMLSHKTILNAPGIGTTGVPLNDPASLKTFQREFNCFLEQL